ncbi:MAG: hypothetical protein NDJ89_11805 [Oligoflexia bacterium]|nr:hypothetical protein [Oligoflexia bacterium]
MATRPVAGRLSQMDSRHVRKSPDPLTFWHSSLPSGSAALLPVIAFVLLSGCRLGNKVEYAPARYRVTQYETAPQTLKFCGLDTKPCVSAATNLLPEDPFTVIITDPMVLIEDLQLGESVLVSSEDNTQGFAYTDQKIFFAGETRRIPMWDAGCETFLTGEIEGGLDTNAVHGPKSAGRAALHLTLTRKFEGPSCTDVLYVMYQCYIDATKCPGATEADFAAAQSDVTWLFGSHLQSGALAPEDLPELRSISYEVFYQ